VDTKQNILIAITILLLFSMVLFMIFGDYGLADLHLMKQEKDRVVEKNEAINQENLSMYREINRLEHDLKYIEKVARDELGMIGKDEIIIKTRKK
jgi:cell division protein FtsB